MKKFFKKILNGLYFLYFDGLSKKEKIQKIIVLVTIHILLTIVLGWLINAYVLMGIISCVAVLLVGTHTKGMYPDDLVRIQDQKKHHTSTPKNNWNPY